MTTVVTLAQPQAVKLKPDLQGQSRQAEAIAFGDAMEATAKTKANVAEKSSGQAEPRWLAPAKFMTAAGPVKDPVLTVLTENRSAEPEEIDEPGDDAPESDDEVEESAAILLAPVAAAGLPHPAFTVRRIAGDDRAPGPATALIAKTEGNGVAVKAEATSGPPPKNAIGADAAPPPASAAPDKATNASIRPAPDSGETAPKPEPAAASVADARPPAPRAAIVIEYGATALPPAATAVNLAEKLGAQAALIKAPARPEMATVPTAPAPVQAHSLKLQLHPAELGVVTASLRFAGEQLTIELQVENAQAHQRLSADSEAIVKTLRGLGYEIDRVTILQPAIAPPAPSRFDADPSLGGQAKPDAQSLDAGGSREGDERFHDRGNRQSGDEPKRDGRNSAGRQEDRSGGSLYI